VPNAKTRDRVPACPSRSRVPGPRSQVLVAPYKVPLYYTVTVHKLSYKGTLSRRFICMAMRVHHDLWDRLVSIPIYTKIFYTYFLLYWKSINISHRLCVNSPYRAAPVDPQLQVWHPPVVPGHRLEPAHHLLLHGQLPQVRASIHKET